MIITPDNKIKADLKIKSDETSLKIDEENGGVYLEKTTSINDGDGTAENGPAPSADKLVTEEALVNYVVNSPSESSLSETAKYGVISELIRWNKFDAPDKYEIHRNNLIYNNYQNNRNPFIDFPEWVDVIYNEDGSFYNGEN